ncbi:MAG: type II toxin-antitoxin system Phd/YefM family antitoxin [Candidatus Nanopelagicales bacterium]|nr:type II toxin-antitoxin system Phd/YefM family antitoxin [Candidatus Nanopelagicales bacterium]
MSVTVGAFEAKTHLSSLLDRVEMGEEITITKHGRPVARLVPAEAHAGVRDWTEFWHAVDENRVALSPGSSIKEDIEAGRS